MGFKRYSILPDLSQSRRIRIIKTFRNQKRWICDFDNFGNILSICSTERKNLKTSGVCHGWTAPIHELAQPACVAHYLISRLKVQMICISEYDFRSYVFYLFTIQSLD